MKLLMFLFGIAIGCLLAIVIRRQSDKPDSTTPNLSYNGYPFGVLSANSGATSGPSVQADQRAASELDIDTNNRWRCVVSGITDTTTAFTVTCYDTAAANNVPNGGK